MGEIQKSKQEIVLQAIHILQEEIAEQKAKIDQMAPYAEQARMCESAGSAMDVSTAAGVVSSNLEEISKRKIEIGRNKMYTILREAGHIRPDVRQAYQRYIDQGLYKNVAPIRGGVVRESVKVTPKGVRIITEMLTETWLPENSTGKKIEAGKAGSQASQTDEERA